MGMDPLSVTASIIAVLQLTGTLIGYLNDVRNASSEQRNVAIEASNLYGLLTSLRYRIEAVQSVDDPWLQQVKMLGLENGPLDQLKDTLETLVGKVGLSSRKRDQIKSALTWQWTKSEADQALQRMERLKSLINCALTNDLVTLSQAIHDGVAALGVGTAQLEIRIKRLQTHAEQELQDRLSCWLGLPDPSTNYRAALEKRHPDTGSWLLNGQAFKEWKSSQSSFMWIHGSASCGKTILSCALLQDILQDRDSHPEIAIGYFYFDFNDGEKQSSKKAIRSLAFQIALLSNGLSSLEQLYTKCEGGSRQPTEDAIRSLLKDTVARARNSYIVLDALDECTDHESFLVFLGELTGVQGLRVIATSRREKDIEEYLNPVVKYNINIEGAVVDKDIYVYTRDRVAADPKLKKWPPAVQGEIVTAITERADGMFRWVYCQLEALRKCIKLSALRKTLSSLPRTLDETYERIIHNIDSSGQLEDAIKSLQWLCFSLRPLNLLEMVDILAVENGDDGGFLPEDRLADPEDIVIVCSSLISRTIQELTAPISKIMAESYGSLKSHDSLEVHGSSESHSSFAFPSGDGIEPERVDQVRLAHFSVKEYLLSDRCNLHSKFQLQICHAMMAESCLRYLLHVFELGPITKELVGQYPLSQYAADNWWQHAEKLDRTPDSVVDLALKLLNDSSALLSWVKLYDMRDPRYSPNMTLTVSDLNQPLYYAVSTGIPEVVQRMLSQTIDLDAVIGRPGTTLYVASEKGFKKIVQILLDTGANIDATRRAANSALVAAAHHSQKEVVRFLLDAGADVNVTAGSLNPASAAGKSGSEEVLQMLLDAGANHDIRSSALHTAIYHQNLMKMLLEAGVNVEARGEESATPLQAAVFYGLDTTVQMLMDAGANVNAPGGQWGSTLTTACQRGHGEIVKMLLKAGAHLEEPKDQDSESVLHETAENDRKEEAKLLLNPGADFIAQGGPWGHALQAASVHGHETVVRMLLDAGANVNAQEGHYGSALQAASVFNHEAVVRMLLDAGANVNAQGGRFGNALQAACTWIELNEELVRMLLVAGADINAQGGWFGSALVAASWRVSSEVMRLLLDNGADVNAQGGRYGNALQAACASPKAQEELVRMLLDAGANINAQGGDFGSALIAASYLNLGKIMRLLLDNGADVNAKHSKYGNALQAARASPWMREEHVRMLLDAGANTSVQGGEPGSAVQAVLSEGDRTPLLSDEEVMDEGV